jgi:hypothetical protein
MAKQRNGWTEKRKNCQRVAIHSWQPWPKSTGPKSAEGKGRASENAFKGWVWLRMRELSERVNRLLREQRASLDAVGEDIAASWRRDSQLEALEAITRAKNERGQGRAGIG